MIPPVNQETIKDIIQLEFARIIDIVPCAERRRCNRSTAAWDRRAGEGVCVTEDVCSSVGVAGSESLGPFRSPPCGTFPRSPAHRRPLRERAAMGQERSGRKCKAREREPKQESRELLD